MDKHQLTKRQELLLIQLTEEAAEVIQMVSKTLRFGLHDTYEGGPNNQERLALEIDDFLALRKMCNDEQIIFGSDEAKVNAKITKVEKYLLYSLSKIPGEHKVIDPIFGRPSTMTVGPLTKPENLVEASEGFTPMIGGKEVEKH